MIVTAREVYDKLVKEDRILESAGRQLRKARFNRFVFAHTALNNTTASRLQ